MWERAERQPESGCYKTMHVSSSSIAGREAVFGRSEQTNSLLGAAGAKEFGRFQLQPQGYRGRSCIAAGNESRVSTRARIIGETEPWPSLKWTPLARRSSLIVIGWVAGSDHHLIRPRIAERRMMQAPAIATAVTPPRCRALQR